MLVVLTIFQLIFSGLNEQDVDLMIVPEVKIAQKVALSHSADLQTSRKQTAKKKDLAKFLGVEESISNNAAADVDASINATTCTNNPSSHSESKYSKIYNFGEKLQLLTYHVLQTQVSGFGSAMEKWLLLIL